MVQTEQTGDGITVLELAGRLDTAACRRLSEQLETLIATGQVRVLIEASRLDYIGSMGLRTLLVAARAARQANGALGLCGVTGPVRRVLDLSGFASTIETYASREDGLARLTAR